MYLIAALVMTFIDRYRLLQVFRVAWGVYAHSASQMSDLHGKRTKDTHDILLSTTTKKRTHELTINFSRQYERMYYLHIIIDRSSPGVPVSLSRLSCGSLAHTCLTHNAMDGVHRSVAGAVVVIRRGRHTWYIYMIGWLGNASCFIAVHVFSAVNKKRIGRRVGSCA